MSKLVPIVAVGALLALGGVALAKSGAGGGLSIQGQDYFNSLPATQQQVVLQRLYAWYTRTRTAGQWPPAVQDPQLANQNDLTDAGNFWLTVDGFQTALAMSNYGGAAGVLDATVAGKLGAL